MMALQLTALFCIMTAFQNGFVAAFRSDYTFIESTHSYYKLYKDPTPWFDAKSKCELEEAVLFHPDNKAELQQVFSTLDVNKNIVSWIGTGVSNSRDVKVYETIDGRPINEVYDTWRSKHPNGNECVFLDIDNHDLVSAPCYLHWPFICKHRITEVVDVEINIANASLKIADLEKLTTNQTAELEVFKQLTSNQTAELEVLKQLTSNQTAELEVFKQLTINQTVELEALKRQQQQETNQTLTLQKIAEKQVVALELLTANQAAAMQQEKETTRVQGATQPSIVDRLMETMHLLIATQAAAMDRQAAAMDRQALLLEKLVQLQGNNDELQLPSEQ